MMHNMCCAKAGAVEAFDAASVGAFAFVGQDGRPRACPVTPYLYAGDAVVSSTLAFTAKVAAVRREGAACLLVHDEEPDMADLRQLTLHGVIRDGTFRAERRAGSLDPSHPGALDQLRTLRALGHPARKNRPVLARWARGSLSRTGLQFLSRHLPEPVSLGLSADGLGQLGDELDHPGVLVRGDRGLGEVLQLGHLGGGRRRALAQPPVGLPRQPPPRV